MFKTRTMSLRIVAVIISNKFMRTNNLEVRKLAAYIFNFDPATLKTKCISLSHRVTSKICIRKSFNKLLITLKYF